MGVIDILRKQKKAIESGDPSVGNPVVGGGQPYIDPNKKKKRRSNSVHDIPDPGERYHHKS